MDGTKDRFHFIKLRVYDNQLFHIQKVSRECIYFFKNGHVPGGTLNVGLISRKDTWISHYRRQSPLAL